jgi:HSF-type DNA-binding
MYRDYSNVQENETKEGVLGVTSSVQNTSQCPAASKINQTVAANFPEKLHYMLKEIKRDGLDHIVSWLPHGRGIMVHKQKEFEKDILP